MTRNDKILFAVAVIAAIGLFLLGRSCGIKSVLKNTTTDTVVTYTKGDTVYVPEIVGVTNTIRETRVITNVRYDTLWGDPINIHDTVLIIGDYFSTRSYSDTQKLARGTVIIDDDISENRIKRRRLQTFGTDTTINKVTILRPPRRFVGYWTLSAFGNYKTPIYGAGMGLGLKTPGDRIYQAEFKLVNGNRPMVEGRVMFPIRIKK